MVGLFLLAAVTTISATPIQNSNDVIMQLATRGKALLVSEESPDKRFKLKNIDDIDTRVFEQRIIKPTHNDPFVDAYIRWKLTSFPIHLPQLSDIAFQKLLEQLPKYPENPRANKTLCDSVARAAAIGRPLNRPEILSLKNKLEESNTQYKIAKSQTTPADMFRLWVIEELQNKPSLLSLAHLERIAATVSAGWNARKAVAQAETAFTTINANGGLPPDAQNELHIICSRISGINRLTLRDVDISFEGTIVPHWQSTAVDEFDLKRLLRLLRKTTETTDGFLGRDRKPPVKSTP